MQGPCSHIIDWEDAPPICVIVTKHEAPAMRLTAAKQETHEAMSATITMSRCLYSVSTFARRCSPLLSAVRQHGVQQVKTARTTCAVPSCGCSSPRASVNSRHVASRQHSVTSTRATEAEVTGKRMRRNRILLLRTALPNLVLRVCIGRGCSCGRRMVGGTKTGYSCWQGHFSRAAP